jgi:hypothetical protein
VSENLNDNDGLPLLRPRFNRIGFAGDANECIAEIKRLSKEHPEYGYIIRPFNLVYYTDALARVRRKTQ